MKTVDLLDKYFETAFAAPDGIKGLRELILTLAMQGKLVPQDPKDRPASELLKEIEAEKKRLIKEEKIKKSKPLPEIKPNEIPYDLPKSWEWLRLGEIVSIKNVSLKAMWELLFPLPPLEEQHRIVAKVDRLMALCDRLEAQLKNQTEKQTALLNAVIAAI